MFQQINESFHKGTQQCMLSTVLCTNNPGQKLLDSLINFPNTILLLDNLLSVSIA